MILDSSAIVAVIRLEPECEAFLSKLAEAPIVGVGAPTLAEAGIVLAARLGDHALSLLSTFVQRGRVVIVTFETAHWQAAAEAWLRFGRDRHEAALNFGDCLAYATAKLAGRPLLCKGDGFAKTDLQLA